MGAALGMGMLTGMAISDLTHPHHHHGGIYDVNVYGKILCNSEEDTIIIIITEKLKIFGL